jgi:hypothetical protein
MAKNDTLSRSFIHIVLLAWAFVFCAGPVLAQEDSRELLGRAWNEYGLQAFSNADKLFAKVLDSERTTQEERWQALLGQAFITHYQMPGRDPQAAIAQYEALLKDVGDNGEWRGQILGRLADCYVEVVPSQMEKARTHYEEALEVLPPRSLLLRETMLRLLSSYLQRPDRAEIARGLQRADELAPSFAASPFESVFHGLRAEMAFFIGDYAALAAALDAQYRAGISNIKVKEVVLFRLARINELELGDYARAEKYYRLLAREIPSSQKAYFAGLRADELKIGKLDSDYAPPLSERVNNATAKEKPDGR